MKKFFLHLCTISNIINVVGTAFEDGQSQETRSYIDMFVDDAGIDAPHVHKFHFFGTTPVVLDASDLHSFKRVDGFLENAHIANVRRTAHFSGNSSIKNLQIYYRY